MIRRPPSEPAELGRNGKRKQVLVTGGTGFTGSHLVRSLAKDGHRVRVVTRQASRAASLADMGVEVVEGDLTNKDTVERAVRGCHEVYHLAAAFREPGIRPHRYREVHVDATSRLLEASRAGGVEHFVHCSTAGVHPHIEHPPADESAPHQPADIYQATKSEGERLALDFQRAHAFPLSVARPAAIYGPGDLRLLKLFRAIAHRRFVMLGSGSVYFHMVHVRDLVNGFRLLARRQESVGEVFIFGGEEYCTLDELAARIAAVWGVPAPKFHVPVWPVYAMSAVCEALTVPFGINPPLYRRRVAFFMKNRAFKIDKAKRVLGWVPEVDLQTGLQETAAWYRANGYV